MGIMEKSKFSISPIKKAFDKKRRRKKRKKDKIKRANERL